MPYARHETFYIRDGWLRKGLKYVGNLRDEDAPDRFGMGKNMVKSLQFWLRATNLVVLDPTSQNNVCSPLAMLLNQYDPFFEDEGTWWLVHFQLATSKEYATTWYWFFNVFNHREFDEITFLYWLQSFAVLQGDQIAKGSLLKDYRCFVNSYLYERQMKSSNSPEDNLNCPLRELRLLRKIGPSSYRVNPVNRDSLHPLIVFYALRQWNMRAQGSEHLTVSQLLEADRGVGRAFLLSHDDMNFYLDKLQARSLLRVTRTAGLDAVSLEAASCEDALAEYYREKGMNG